MTLIHTAPMATFGRTREVTIGKKPDNTYWSIDEASIEGINHFHNNNALNVGFMTDGKPIMIEHDITGNNGDTLVLRYSNDQKDMTPKEDNDHFDKMNPLNHVFRSLYIPFFNTKSMNVDVAITDKAD